MSYSSYGKAVRDVARFEREIAHLREAGESTEQVRAERDAKIGEAVRQFHIDGHQLLKDAMQSLR